MASPAYSANEALAPAAAAASGLSSCEHCDQPTASCCQLVWAMCAPAGPASECARGAGSSCPWSKDSKRRSDSKVAHHSFTCAAGSQPSAASDSCCIFIAFCPLRQFLSSFEPCCRHFYIISAYCCSTWLYLAKTAASIPWSVALHFWTSAAAAWQKASAVDHPDWAFDLRPKLICLGWNHFYSNFDFMVIEAHWLLRSQRWSDFGGHASQTWYLAQRSSDWQKRWLHRFWTQRFHCWARANSCSLSEFRLCYPPTYNYYLMQPSYSPSPSWPTWTIPTQFGFSRPANWWNYYVFSFNLSAEHYLSVLPKPDSIEFLENSPGRHFHYAQMYLESGLTGCCWTKLLYGRHHQRAVLLYVVSPFFIIIWGRLIIFVIIVPYFLKMLKNIF